MSFQFQCPQGHLLEGLPETAGQNCQCPTCGILFIIPQPLAEPEEPQRAAFPDVTGKEQEQRAPEVTAPIEELHFVCPSGHPLEATRDMLDQDVLCPFCQAQFHLRERDSLEEQRKRALEEEGREKRVGNVWLRWSVVLVCLVMLGLLLLILSTSPS